VNLK
jgi:predicted dehydrogenase